MNIAVCYALVIFSFCVESSPITPIQEKIDFSTIKRNIIDTHSCLNQKDCAQKKYLSTKEPLLLDSQFKLLIQEAKKEVPEAHEALKNIRQELKLRAAGVSAQANEDLHCLLQNVAILGLSSAIFLAGFAPLVLSVECEDSIIRSISAAIGGIALVGSGFYMKKAYNNINLVRTDLSMPQAVHTMIFAAAQIEQIEGKFALEKIK